MDQPEQTVNHLKVLIHLCLLIIIVMLCAMGYAFFNLIQMKTAMVRQSHEIHSLQLDGIHYQAALDYYTEIKANDSKNHDMREPIEDEPSMPDALKAVYRNRRYNKNNERGE